MSVYSVGGFEERGERERDSVFREGRETRNGLKEKRCGFYTKETSMSEPGTKRLGDSGPFNYNRPTTILINEKNSQ